MSGQRKKGKSCMSVWLTGEQMLTLEEMINSGVVRDKSDFVKQAIKRYAEEKGINKNEDGK